MSLKGPGRKNRFSPRRKSAKYGNTRHGTQILRCDRRTREGRTIRAIEAAQPDALGRTGPIHPDLSQGEGALMKSRLLTLDQVAERLQLKKSWFYQRIHARALPFRYCKIGLYLRFLEDDLEQFIEDQLARNDRHDE